MFRELSVQDEYDFFNFIGNFPKMHFEFLAASRKNKYFTQQTDDLIKLVTSSVSNFSSIFFFTKRKLIRYLQFFKNKRVQEVEIFIIKI